MAEIIRMPKLSDTMTEGVVSEWHKKIGDVVSTGDLLADIETDKATMEFEAFQEGTLLHIGVDKGKAAAVDAILAIVGKKGEKIEDLLKEEPAKPAEEKEAAPVAKAAPAPPPKTAVAPIAAKAAPAVVQTAPPSVSDNGHTLASPLARKLAMDQGINLSAIRGSGDNGRVVRRDIEKYTASSGASNFVGVERFTEVEVSQMRKVIASRLAESKFTSPHFYLTIDMDMDAAMEARKSINTQIAPEKISFNDFVVKAAAEALREHPKVNSSWLGDRIRYNEHINVGVAVSVEDGLLVPVVRFADGKTMRQISGEVRSYAERARSKKLQPEDWEGSTFTISNLGMFGIEEFTAIINPPDACIMAVGAIRSVPVVKGGQVVPGNRMKVTLSCDHRVVDGALGSAFLQTFKTFMENPVLLLGKQAI